MGYILIDLNWIFLIKPSEFLISLSDESYNEKSAENSKLLHCRKAHSIQPIKDIEPKF